MVTNTVEAAAWPAPGMVWGRYPQRRVRRDGRPAARAGEPGLALWLAQALAPLRTARAPGRSESALQRASAAMRALGIEPRAQQLRAARAMLHQCLVEMDTGEGKTVAIALAAGAAALLGTPVHVVTANDYLARRDALAFGAFYAALGLRCAWVDESMEAPQRRSAYAQHITYVTGKELAFDYMRDSWLHSSCATPLEERFRRAGGAQQPVLRGLCMAILDEADTLLVDEARMPLVLAQKQETLQASHLRHALELARSMRERVHFRLSAHGDTVRLLDAGRTLVAEWRSDGDPLLAHPAQREDVIQQALTALHVLRRDRDYVVLNDAVALVDPHTGRAAGARMWSRGLHQLVEIKEGLAATAATRTVSSLTYQQFFGRYLRLAGTSGTLREARSELRRVFGLAFIRVPPHQPRRVVQLPQQLFASTPALCEAAARRAVELSRQGRAVLVGASSVAECERIAERLRAIGASHALLHAAHGADEREVVAAAGRAGRITIASSMAGRGSDIALDRQAREAGGLHVLLCQLNDARRIDRQFIGRAGRQGDPGSWEQWLALDFALLRPRPIALLASLLWRLPLAPLRPRAIALLQWWRSRMHARQRIELALRTDSEDRFFAYQDQT